MFFLVFISKWLINSFPCYFNNIFRKFIQIFYCLVLMDQITAGCIVKLKSRTQIKEREVIGNNVFRTWEYVKWDDLQRDQEYKVSKVFENDGTIMLEGKSFEHLTKNFIIVKTADSKP